MPHSMQPAVYYRALQVGNDAFIAGHFLNGLFYEGNHLIGKVDDNGTFRFFERLLDGHPTVPEHVVGYVNGLLLTFMDGTVFNLVETARPIFKHPD